MTLKKALEIVMYKDIGINPGPDAASCPIQLYGPQTILAWIKFFNNGASCIGEK